MDQSETANSGGAAALRAALRAKLMANAEAELADGNMAGVLHAIIAAAAGNQPLPGWARGALMRIEQGLARGEISDLNEAFGWSQEATVKPAPQWAKEVLIRYRATAELPVDLNDEFLLRTEGVGHRALRRSESKRRRDSGTVLAALMNARRNGKPIAVQTFEELAEQLSESRAFVEKVYNEHSEQILAIKPGPPGTGANIHLSWWD